MKIALVLCVLIPRHVFAQSSKDSLTPLNRMEYAAGAVAGLSLIDYVAYGLNNHKAPFPYRPVQALAQIGMTYLLYKMCDLKTALAFGTMAWTWNLDLAFYGWGYLFNPAWDDRWENRSRLGLYSHNITWASWTPVGLLRPPGTGIAHSTVLAQSMVGISLSILLSQ